MGPAVGSLLLMISHVTVTFYEWVRYLKYKRERHTGVHDSIPRLVRSGSTDVGRAGDLQRHGVNLLRRTGERKERDGRIDSDTD